MPKNKSTEQKQKRRQKQSQTQFQQQVVSLETQTRTTPAYFGIFTTFQSNSGGVVLFTKYIPTSSVTNVVKISSTALKMGQ